MAKIFLQIKLVSSFDTGFYYVTKRILYKTEKLELKKYDPKIRKHMIFRSED